MKRLTLLFILIVSGKFLFSQNFTEILGRPAANSITVRVMFYQPSDFYLEWGTDPGNYSSSSAVLTTSAGTPAETVITGLNPDTKYYYRTRYRQNGGPVFLSGQQHAFHTQRAPGSRFRFTVESDVHPYDKKGCLNLWDIALDNQLKDTADFMFDMGDTFGDDHQPFTITSEQVKKLHLDCLPHFARVCHSMPLFFCLGNHEGEFDYYLAQTPPNNLAVYGTTWRKYYYPNPYPDDFYTGNPDVEPYNIGHPENYYAFTWGDALFVVLDAYRYQCDTSAKPKNWEWSLGFQQYSWLKSTLEQSTSKYKFVFAHHVRGQGRGGVSNARFFEWGGYDANGTTNGFAQNRPGWAKPIHQLFVDNGVNIFFQGHDHLFAHEVLDGVVYQEVPMPSDSTYKIGMLANAGAYLSDTLDGSGHIRVTVSPECLRIDYVRAYLPADTLAGVHHNRENAFSYTFGTCSSQSVSDQLPLPDVKIFPNPAREYATIAIPEPAGDLTIRMTNLYGETILQTNAKTLDVAKIPDGVYFLCINYAKRTLNKRIIILH